MKKDTILVIDDNRHLGDFIAHSLLPSMGFEGKPVFDGASALKEIRELKPALLLLDLELPDINGLDLLRTLKQEGLSIPTILFTAHGSETIAIEAFRLGVEDYLIKPVKTEQLEAAINRALEETRLRREKAQLMTELNEQVNWLVALSKIGQSVTSTLELDEVLRRIVEAGVHLTQADEGFLALLDQTSGDLYLRATKNIDGEIISSVRLPINNSLLGEVLSRGKPVRRTDQQDGTQIEISTGLLVHSLLHVPIFSKGRPLGVLSVDNRENRHPFTPKDEVLLTSLADYAAVALENAGLYQQARREITERKRVELALRESEERYVQAVRGANDGIWDFNLKKNTSYFSPRWKEMLGYEEQEIGNDPNEWFHRVHPDDIQALKNAVGAHINGKTPHLEAEYRIRHKDGTYRWMLCRGIAVRGEVGGIGRISGSQTDISERKNSEARLLYDASHDKLTGLSNRAHLLDNLHKAIQRVREGENYAFAVLFLDLDEFKDINDSLGHPTGDQLLISVSQTLKSLLRENDIVARLGGDEFVILLDGIRDSLQATEKSQEILEVFSSPVRLGSHNLVISASIGIVLSTLDYDNPEDVLRDADIAMYAAKSQGKSKYQLFNPLMREKIVKRIALEAELKEALDKRQLLLCYQPIVSFQQGRLFGLEALVHWNHPQLGILPASKFIPVAQEIGLILPIDWWVFEEACSQLHYWQSRFQFDPPLKVSLNLGSSLLLHSNLIDAIQQTLQRTGIRPQNLALEIAESIVSLNVDVLSQSIAELMKIGVSVQIDDFGTSYSSLLHLKELPVNGLKIDPAFVCQINEMGENTEIPGMMIELAHELGIEAFAEGVETPAQLKYLRQLGCDYGQGYLFCSPMEAEATCNLLEAAARKQRAALPWQNFWNE